MSQSLAGPAGTRKPSPKEAPPMNLAGNIRSFWSGARAILAGSHKTTVVICPTAELPAKVGLDSVERLESCSRWPELEGCSQACMPQVKFSAEDLEEFTA